MTTNCDVDWCDIDLRGAIKHVAQTGCYLLPTKRMAYRLAYILSQNRVRPCDLVRAQELLSELWKRIERAKI